MFALGGDYYDSDWNVTVNKGGALQAAEYLLDIYQNTAPVGSTGYSFDEVFTAMAESRGAMLLTYGWMLAGLNDPAKSQVAGKVEMTVTGEMSPVVQAPNWMLRAWFPEGPADALRVIITLANK